MKIKRNTEIHNNNENPSDLNFKNRKPILGPLGKVFINIKYWLRGEYNLRKKLHEIINNEIQDL